MSDVHRPQGPPFLLPEQPYNLQVMKTYITVPGDKRIRKAFVWLPFSFQGKTYWMETIEICEFYHRLNWGGLMSTGYGRGFESLRAHQF